MSLMRDAIGVLLAGGQGERLWPLTRDRAKPAVPFGGVYRIIDVTLSNCINSDLRRVFVLTQYKALSLNRHTRQGWSQLLGLGEFIEVLPPQMRVSTNWYLGTADAVYQNIYSIGSEHSRYVIILSGDHIYKMNYQKMLQQHVDSGADVTVATFEVPSQEAAGRFGVIETDANWRIVGFEEKPALAEAFAPPSGHGQRLHGRLRVQYPAADSGAPWRTPRTPIPSTISAAISCRAFSRNTASTPITSSMKIKSARNIGATLAPSRPIMKRTWTWCPSRRYSICMTRPGRSAPGSTNIRRVKTVFADPNRMGVALDSMVGGGSIISGGRVNRSVLGYDVRTNSYSEVEKSILFNHVTIGRHARVRNAIIDRHVTIPERAEIGYDLEADRQRYHVTEGGIVVVVREESMIEEPE